MNLNTLRLFVTIVQHGSLSKTSDKLNIPIATISRQISELEKELNIQLFDRQKSGVRPTLAGQKLYDEVYLSIDNLLNAKQVLFDDEQNLKGILRISAPPNCKPVLKWIGDFQTHFPNVQIHCTMTERILDLSSDGIDVAFRIGDLHGDSFIAKKVKTIHTKWVAHPDLIAQFGTPKTLFDLVNFPLAGFAKNGETTISLKMGKDKLSLPYVFACNESFALEFMAKNAHAMCLLDEFTVNQLIEESGLIEVLPTLNNPSFDLSMIYASQRYPSAIVRAFVEFVLEKAGE